MTGRGRSRGRSTDPYPLKKQNSTHDGSERPRQLPLAVNALPVILVITSNHRLIIGL